VPRLRQGHRRADEPALQQRELHRQPMLRRSAAAPRRILRFLRHFYGRVLALTPAGVTYGRSRGRRPATLSTATSDSGSRLAAGSAPDVRERTQLTPAGQTLVGECFEEIGKPLRPQDRVCRDRGRGQQHDDEVPKLHERRRQPHRAGSCRESGRDGWPVGVESHCPGTHSCPGSRHALRRTGARCRGRHGPSDTTLSPAPGRRSRETSSGG
jgi:hypothetical protein